MAKDPIQKALEGIHKELKTTNKEISAIKKNQEKSMRVDLKEPCNLKEGD